MDSDVKTPRQTEPKDSEGSKGSKDSNGPGKTVPRQARTRRTRAAVVEAARELFLERGYAASTIEAISDRSDTPQPTVYRLFSSKLGILKALLNVSVAGDDEAIPMLDRPQVRALLSDDDPKRQLQGFAALVRDVMDRAGAVHRIVADAARSDEDASSLLAEIARQRHEGQRRVARQLARSGALRPGMKRARGRRRHSCVGVARGVRPAGPRPRLERRTVREVVDFDPQRTSPPG